MTINKQIVLTIVGLLCLFLLFEFSNIDILFQDAFYNFESKQWALDRSDAVLKFIFYDGIKKLFIVFVSLILAALIFFRKTETIQSYWRGLLIVFLSAILVPLSVSVLKGATNIPCPKNITHYNGSYPHVTVLKTYPKSFYQTKRIRCFPAGHASGGFALLSLFFLFKKKRNRIIALASVMVISWSIGTYKMLIGDHFLSHTVLTMLLAWLIVLLIAKSVDTFFVKQANDENVII